MIRRWFCFCLAAALLCTGALAQPLPDMGQMVRLHVVAEDDSPAAQALKLELRDVCLRSAQVCMGDAKDGDEAYLRLQNHLDDFASACIARARELGYIGEITAETGSFFFPEGEGETAKELAVGGKVACFRLGKSLGEGLVIIGECHRDHIAHKCLRGLFFGFGCVNFEHKIIPPSWL